MWKSFLTITSGSAKLSPLRFTDHRKFSRLIAQVKRAGRACGEKGSRLPGERTSAVDRDKFAQRSPSARHRIREREKVENNVRFMRFLGSLYFIRQIDRDVKAFALNPRVGRRGCGLFKIHLRVIHLCIFLSCTFQNTFYFSRVFVVLVFSISRHFSLYAIPLFNSIFLKNFVYLFY